MRFRHVRLAMVVALCAAPPLAHALTAREVLDQAKRLDDTTRHWTDRRQKMTLHLYGRGEGEQTRDLQLYTKRYPDDEDRSICFLRSPADMSGMGFLQWTHKKSRDEQWLYLPQYKRTRRIVARDRDEGFLFTDFSYDDLRILARIQSWTEDDASAQLVGEGAVDGTDCYQIDLQPRQEDIAYKRITMWLDRVKLVPRKLDFHDRDGIHVKTLTLDDVRDIGPIPTPHRLEMRNLETGSRTVADIAEVVYDTGLSGEFFTPHQLEIGGL